MILAKDILGYKSFIMVMLVTLFVMCYPVIVNC